MEVREKNGCLARQPSYKIKFRITGLLTDDCMSCYGHTTHNNISSAHKLRNMIWYNY